MPRAGLVVILSFVFVLANFAPAQARLDARNVDYEGYRADGSTLLASFNSSLTAVEITNILARRGFAAQSYHLRSGVRYAASEIAKKSLAAESPAFVLISLGAKDLGTALSELKAIPQIDSVSPNWVHHLDYAPNDPYYDAYQDNFRQIGAEDAWNLANGFEAVVAVIDTGYRSGIDDGVENLLEGYDFRGEDTDVQDGVGHGTHVSNTVAENTDNGLGAAGLAYRASILPLKVFTDDPEDEGAYEADIVDAINYAAANGANVINMSLGGGGYSQISQDACSDAHDAGVVIFASSGNSGVSPVEYPSAYEDVISVGSCGSHTEAQLPSRSGFANSGEGLDIVAPGEHIVQQTYEPYSGKVGYYSYYGTSMSSPHASALAALMISVGGADPDEIEQIIFDTAARSGSAWDAHIGWGEIDAFEAVKEYRKVTSGNDVDDDASEETDCAVFLGILYNSCDRVLLDEGEKLTRDEAEDLCKQDVGDWNCLKACSASDEVNSCGELAACMESECDASVVHSDGTDDDDDDDDIYDPCGS